MINLTICRKVSWLLFYKSNQPKLKERRDRPSSNLPGANAAESNELERKMTLVNFIFVWMLLATYIQERGSDVQMLDDFNMQRVDKQLRSCNEQ
jgi:hypothetical protein